MSEVNNIQLTEVNSPSTTVPGHPAELVSRLRVIEDQPLDQRAGAFVQIHDRLHATLEGGDASQQNG